jgi:hypothetical protein
MMKKSKFKLIASAPSCEELRKMIAQYFCDKPERYKFVYGMADGGPRQLFRDGKAMEGYRIAPSKGRFRFERLEN